MAVWIKAIIWANPQDTMLPFLFIFIPLFLLSLMHLSRAAIANFTIDDTLPGPNREAVIYDPPSAWNSKGVCPGGTCSIAPDANRILNGTWHESSFHAKPAPNLNDFPNQPLSATANFRGSAVYVYAVLPPLRKDKISATTITFSIDGVSVDEFSYTSGPDYVYDALVYANPSLSLGSHKITIFNGKPNGADSLFILDRIVYSTVVDEPQALLPVSTGPEQPIPTAPPRPPNLTSSGEQSSSAPPTESGESISIKPSDQNPTILINGSATYTISASVPYTTPSSLPPSPDAQNGGKATSNRSLSTGAIVGAVLGSLAGVVAVLFMVLYYRRSRGTGNKHWIAQPGDIQRNSLPSQPSFGAPTGWLIATDSKREVLMASSPPAYYQGNN